MQHSHVDGWSPVQIERSIDQHLNRVSLPALNDLQVTNWQASATVSSKLAIKRADLFYTTDTRPLLDRRWQSATATVDGNSITVYSRRRVDLDAHGNGFPRRHGQHASSIRKVTPE